MTLTRCIIKTTKNRLRITIVCLGILYAAISVALMGIGLNNDYIKQKQLQKEMYRANIVDINGIILATNVNTVSLYAHPKHISNIAFTVERLHKIFPYLSKEYLLSCIQPQKHFVWIKKHISLYEYDEVQKLGIAGIHTTDDQKRFYPHENIISHVLGFVDTDGHGASGVERYYDSRLTHNAKSPLKLGIDIRVQHILHHKLSEAMRLHSAKGAIGIVMHAKTGLIVASVSLPDFNPNKRKSGIERCNKSFFNQLSLGVFEMGSVFKALTAAMALDLKCVDINDVFDVSRPIRLGSRNISDYRGKGGYLSFPEVLKYSSNIGMVLVNDRIGIQKQIDYLSSLAMFDRLHTDIFEIGSPIYPKKINRVYAATMSYGHGIAATPLHMASAFASTINGGVLHTPHFGVEFEDHYDKQVFAPSTSKMMRKLMRIIVTEGFSKKANVDGYYVGGKTGTAEKIVNGRYDKNLNFAFFIGAFPIFDPEYIVLIGIDEAKRNSINMGFTTGGMVAAPVGGDLIKQIAPLLGVGAVTMNSFKGKNIDNQLYVHYQAKHRGDKRHRHIRASASNMRQNPSSIG